MILKWNMYRLVTHPSNSAINSPTFISKLSESKLDTKDNNLSMNYM